MSGTCCPGNGGVLLDEKPAGVGTRVHLSLNVRNLEASVAFYTALLGVDPHKRRPGYANFAPGNLALKLALNEFLFVAVPKYVILSV